MYFYKSNLMWVHNIGCIDTFRVISASNSLNNTIIIKEAHHVFTSLIFYNESDRRFEMARLLALCILQDKKYRNIEENSFDKQD